MTISLAKTEQTIEAPHAALEPIVAVRDLTVAFVQRERKVAAVNGLSFDLAPAEVLTILGESGSGKSVTLRALMGLLSRARKSERYRACRRP